MSILAGVPQGENLLVDVFEGFFVDNPVGTLLLEGSVQVPHLIYKKNIAIQLSTTGILTVVYGYWSQFTFGELGVFCHLLQIAWLVPTGLQNIHVDVLFRNLLLSFRQLDEKPVMTNQKVP